MPVLIPLNRLLTRTWLCFLVLAVVLVPFAMTPGLSAGQEASLAALAAKELDAFCDSKDDGDNNIRIGQVAGYAGLRKFLAGTPLDRQAEIDRRFNVYWSKIAAAGDLDEDASNYDSLGMVFLIDLARLLGREDDFRRSANFRRQFERFRDIVSPAGWIPEYGDAYFDYASCPLDRVYLLEYAAKLYDDPTFLYAARKLYRRPQAALPGPDIWTRALALIDLQVTLAEPRLPSGPPSLVTRRARQGSTKTFIDKLILRTGWEPGSAMILMDLYASGSHAHKEKGPSIAYYECRQVPLFHNLGRHATRSAIAGNLCWALPSGQRFPGSWNEDDTWFTMSIPVAYLPCRDDGYVVAPGMSLRNFQERSGGCRCVFFDNLRLEGPAGVKMIDDFDRTAGWDPRLVQRTEIVATADRTQGLASQRVAWKTIPSGEFKRTFSQGKETVITKDQYDSLKLDLKFTGQRPYAHLRGLGQQVDLGDQLLVSELADARVEQREHDAFGRVVYSSYSRVDCMLTRRMILTAEGYLVVHDRLTPGRMMDGWNAGTLWQLYEEQGIGRDWFCADDDGTYPAGVGSGSVTPQRMLVKFDTSAGAETGIEEIKQECHAPNPKGRRPNHFFTSFVRRKLSAGQPAGFTFVVLPHSPSEASPDAAAAQIAIDSGSNDAVSVKISGRGDRPDVKITLRGDDWSIARPQGR